MISNKIDLNKVKNFDEFIETIIEDLVLMKLHKKHAKIECLIESKDGGTYLSEFNDIGKTLFDEWLIVYTEGNNESCDIFHFAYEDLECIFVDTDDDKEYVLRTRIKFKDTRITFRYKYVDYKEYIKSEEWKHKRKEVLERDKFKCRLCGAKGTEYNLHVHHNSYNNLGNEPLEDLITLCKECHEIYHKN